MNLRLVDKPLGATPLETLDMLRTLHPELADEKLSYAGRLDPMASGLLVVLGGDLLKRQEEFWYLPKEYSVSILLGVRTDSYDLLGLADDGDPDAATLERVLAVFQHMVGKFSLAVPMFSSRRTAGKPLFAWAKDGTTVAAPLQRMAVHQIDVCSMARITSAEMLVTIQHRVSLVSGDFRQEAILSRWSEILESHPDVRFPVVRCIIHCSSGTYIRSLAHEIGQRIGSGGMVYDLRRTRVGAWRVDDSEVVRFPSVVY